MSVMRARSSNGTFIIYDLGGGTLDVAIADGLDGRVSLQAHGGIEMCGGRDWDRAIVANIVRPWLEKNFDLPEDASTNQAYRSEEHTSELQSLMRISYAVFCFKKKKK